MSEILRVNSLTFGYGKSDVLKNVSFSINKGEFVSIIGENGSGKTTIIKVINSLFSGYGGSILFKGADIKTLSHRQRAAGIAVIYQGCECRFPFNCFEVVSMGAYPYAAKPDIDFIRSVMLKTDTLCFADKPINHLSGGQKQRVMLARALVQRPELMLLDEAMSALDISAKIEMTDIILEKCHTDGMSALSVMHDINMAFEKSDRIIALKNGEVYACDKPQALLNKDFFREVFNVEVKFYDNNKYFRII